MDGECLVPLDIKTGATFQGRSGSWGLLVFPAADTQANQQCHMIIIGQFKLAKCESLAAIALTALPRCLRLALFEYYQDKVLTDVKSRF